MSWTEPPEKWLDGNIQYKHWRLYRDDPWWTERLNERGMTFKTLMEEARLHYNLNPNLFEAINTPFCSICRLIFDSDGWRNVHFKTYKHKLARAKKLNLDLPPHPLWCTVCKYQCQTIKEKRSHSEGKNYKHQCELAVQEGKPKPVNKLHCIHCNITLTSVSAMRRHENSEDHKSKTQQERLFCEPCQQSFGTRDSWKAHQTTKKHLQTVGKQKKIKLETWCKVCHKEETFNRRAYVKHIKTTKHKKRIAKLEELKKCVPCKTLIV